MLSIIASYSGVYFSAYASKLVSCDIRPCPVLFYADPACVIGSPVVYGLSESEIREDKIFSSRSGFVWERGRRGTAASNSLIFEIFGKLL
jgi:hypothetical protein